MSRHIIPMPRDSHQAIQSLLPWYVTGGLDGKDQAAVKAHLALCEACRAEVADEHRLAAAMADLPVHDGGLDVDDGWAAMVRRMDLGAARAAPAVSWAERLRGLRTRLFPMRQAQSSWLGWAVAAQFCLLAMLGGIVWRDNQPARYHTLSSPAAPTAANLVVIFRPETPEMDLRQMLRASGARLVDGPTNADAYLLRVPATRRAAALADLRRRAEVVLVEPLDGG